MDTTNQQDPETKDRSRPRGENEVALVDVLRPVYRQRRLIWQGTVIALITTLLLGGIYLFWQPGRSVASLGFRPMFEGAAEGRYPNGIAFAPSDIVAPTVVEQVFARNNLGEYCEYDLVQAGLFVQESSPELHFLNLEFEARLSDARLTGIERDRLQAEYANRRASVPLHYELSFLQPLTCRRIPDAIIFKALADVLETWARDSQEKRGVTNLNVSVLTPAIFDQINADNLLIRTDLLRTALNRVITNISAVEVLPGSELVRGGSSSSSLQEVRAELEDLLQARLNPLVAQAGRRLGGQSLQWVEHALQTALIRQAAAQQRAETYRLALREYSGVPATPSAPALSGEGLQSPGNVQQPTPQIDRTFIDRIVELSSTNVTFRQEITRRAIDAALEAVSRTAVVEQYRQLRETLARGGDSDLPADMVATRLDEIQAQAKRATQQFNEIYAQFSKISLHPGPFLYRIERPAESTTVRSFEPRNLLFLLLVVLIAVPFVLAAGVLVDHHARRLVKVIR